MNARNRSTLLALALALATLVRGPAMAFDGEADQRGAFSLKIDEIRGPDQADIPASVRVSIHNQGDEPASFRVRLHGLTDNWHAVGSPSRDLTVMPGQMGRHTFHIAVSNRVYRALYPVQVTADGRLPDGETLTLHAVQVFRSGLETPLLTAPTPVADTPLVFDRVLALEQAGGRVMWQYIDHPLRHQPHGWQGQHPTSGVSVSIGDIDRGADRRRALCLHPPWRGGRGTVFVEYWVELPRASPLTLTFANAIRSHGAEEPPSDGVTFRAWVEDEIAFERHTDSMAWVPGEVDLSRWAGQAVRLRLESHPGPRLDTTCDGSYWAKPTIWAGPRPTPRSESAWQKALDLARSRLLGPDGNDRFDLGNGNRALYLPGEGGPHEAIIGFAGDGQVVLFRGIELSLDGRPLGDPRSGFHLSPPPTSTDNRGHPPSAIRLHAWAEGGSMKLQATAPEGHRITDFALGPADQAAKQVYFGHGYAIRDPAAFRMDFGGHSLSSSHVGADYENGLSLLTASDVPPTAFEIDPGRHLYSLRTRYDATLTLVPGGEGALDCAVRYRPLYDKPAAPGVADKAGRFVFDIWGGSYRDHIDLIRDAVAYGLTYSLLTVHVWQRWGYDYRLPDIFPPDPTLGDLADLKELSALCRLWNIPWGLHDNYIDFYPDAKSFSYGHIAFTGHGQPVQAWLHEARDAQSYRWRPDRFQPFLLRNLEQITPALGPSHSFVDVFTSIPPVEFYGDDGSFHSALVTREHWNQAFDTIRGALTAPAITASEAGHDQLTGHLDGADCQFLRLSDHPGRHVLTLPCGDWERVPWYDAVLHDRFILHGVGYSTRYQGERPRSLHGIESDDYLSAEILTGHALMSDRVAGLTGAVRKYWLAQPWAESIAMDRMASATFVDDHLHRLRVRWASGAEARINRGTNDWHAAGRVLPGFGFLASAGDVTCAVERIDGYVVERASWPGGYYVNARTYAPTGPYAITPVGAELQFDADDTMRFTVQWNAEEPLPAEASVFVHGIRALPSDSLDIAFQADHRPARPTTKWAGVVHTGGDPVHLPPGLAPGRYPIVVGLYTPDGHRFALLGNESDTRRYRVGDLVVTEGQSPRWEPRPFTAPKGLRNPTGTRIDFGSVITDGAFRLTAEHEHLQLTPLPGSPAMQVTLRTPPWFPGHRITAVQVLHRDGRTGPPIPWRQSPDNRVSFATRAGDFAYRMDTERVPSH